jgi:hypothetical protein
VRKYLYTIAAITIGLLSLPLLEKSLPWSLHDQYINLLIFFTLQSLVIAIMLRQGEKKPERMPLFALATVSFRLITALIFLIVMYLVGVEEVTNFAAHFVAVYLVYLVFELTLVLTNLRRS